MLVKELTLSENEAYEIARETGESPESTNGFDEVAHPVQVHWALLKWVHAALNCNTSEERKYAYLFPECANHFQTVL